MQTHTHSSPFQIRLDPSGSHHKDSAACKPGNELVLVMLSIMDSWPLQTILNVCNCVFVVLCVQCGLPPVRLLEATLTLCRTDSHKTSLNQWTGRYTWQHLDRGMNITHFGMYNLFIILCSQKVTVVISYLSHHLYLRPEVLSHVIARDPL